MSERSAPTTEMPPTSSKKSGGKTYNQRLKMLLRRGRWPRKGKQPAVESAPPKITSSVVSDDDEDEESMYFDAEQGDDETGIWEMGSDQDDQSGSSSETMQNWERQSLAVQHGLFQLLDQHQHTTPNNKDAPRSLSTSATGSATSAPTVAPTPVQFPIHDPHAYPCQDGNRAVPSPPSTWPQAPMMLRATPPSLIIGGNRDNATRIRGIRFAGSRSYQNFNGYAGCILPINNGREKMGKSLVIDFESPLFAGTLQLRIKDLPSLQGDDDEAAPSYFDGKKRKFQAVVKGRFKKPLPMAQCVTGQVFDRPAGKLPARWVVDAMIQFISVLAPQLEVDLDSQHPRFLTPLVATAHTVMQEEYSYCTSSRRDKDGKEISSGQPQCKPVQSPEALEQIVPDGDERLKNYLWYTGSTNIDVDTPESPMVEPPSTSPLSVLYDFEGNEADSSAKAKKVSVPTRIKKRKKLFNRLAAAGATEPLFDTSKEYTFEFYQHLLIMTDDDDIKLDMGRALGGKVGLSSALNGQPIKFISAHRDPETGEFTPLWSFDLWHQALHSFASAQSQAEI